MATEQGATRRGGIPRWVLISGALLLLGLFGYGVVTNHEHRATVRINGFSVSADVLVQGWPGTRCTVELGGPGVDITVWHYLQLDSDGEGTIQINTRRAADSRVTVTTACGGLTATSRHRLY